MGALIGQRQQEAPLGVVADGRYSWDRDKTMRSAARRNAEEVLGAHRRASGRRWDGSWGFTKGSSGLWSSKVK